MQRQKKLFNKFIEHLKFIVNSILYNIWFTVYDLQFYSNNYVFPGQSVDSI